MSFHSFSINFTLMNIDSLWDSGSRVFYIFNFLIILIKPNIFWNMRTGKKNRKFKPCRRIVPLALLSDVVVTLDVGCKMKSLSRSIWKRKMKRVGSSQQVLYNCNFITYRCFLVTKKGKNDEGIFTFLLLKEGRKRRKG